MVTNIEIVNKFASLIEANFGVYTKIKLDYTHEDDERYFVTAVSANNVKLGHASILLSKTNRAILFGETTGFFTFHESQVIKLNIEIEMIRLFVDELNTDNNRITLLQTKLNNQLGLYLTYNPN